MEGFILLLLKNFFLYIYIMTVTLCVKKIYNTLIYITVKYYKLYDNTYIKKRNFFLLRKNLITEEKKKEYKYLL